MKNLDLILDEQGMAEVRRNSIENKLLHSAKVRIVAYKGGFDGLATPREIYLAKIRGILPKGFEVHHIIPLCCRNTQITLDNMVVMDSASHRFLHKNLYDRVLSKCPVGCMVRISIPDFDVFRVARHKTFDEQFLEYMKARQKQ